MLARLGLEPGDEEFYAEQLSGILRHIDRLQQLNTDHIAPTAQVVVVRFPPVKKGQSIRLRISETYTAIGSYRLEGDDLVFDRSLGRPRNAVVLPEGWYLTASAIPTTVSLLADGRVRLDFWNGRPDSADVLIKAKRRVASGQKKR